MSTQEMASDNPIDKPRQTPPTTRFTQFRKHPVTRVVTGVIIALVIAWFLYSQRQLLTEGWQHILSAYPWWLGAAVLAIILTMMSQAEVMVILLRAAGVPVPRWEANRLGLAANAWSATFPGGPAISAAMIFREQLRWGATPIIASWYMVLSGLLAAAGMAVLALGAVFFLGLKVQLSTVITSVVITASICAACYWILQHPYAVQRCLVAAGRRWNRWRKKPEDRFTKTLEQTAAQLRSVQIPASKLLAAQTASLINWLAEIACLLACVYAIGGQAPIAGVMLSFLAAKLVGQAQVTPGGLGPVDVTLTTSLVAVGTLPIEHAVAAVIVFRVFSFIALTAVGWIVYFAGPLRDKIRQ